MNLPKKVNDEMLGVLKSAKSQLPWGAQSEIARRSKYSKEYVRQFFEGMHEISKDNIKILNVANSMIDDNKKEGKELEARAIQLASDIIVKTAKAETDF